MKKSIAVLSLSLAGLLGLAACGSSPKNPDSSQSASSSASVSATASASANSSSSSSASSESTSSSSSSSAKAESTSSSSAKSSTKGSETQASGSSANPALPNGASDSSYGPKVYETYKEAVEEAKKDPSAKKTTNADGNVYAASDGSIAIVEAKNGNYIAVQNDGSWLRVTPEGEAVTVDAKGSWALFKTNGEVAHVDENGATSIVNIKTFEVSTDYQSLEVPKTPAPVGISPLRRPPSRRAAWQRTNSAHRHNRRLTRPVRPVRIPVDACGAFSYVCSRLPVFFPGILGLESAAGAQTFPRERC